MDCFLTTSPYALGELGQVISRDFPNFFPRISLFTLAISVGAFIMAMFLGIVFVSLFK